VEGEEDVVALMAINVVLVLVVEEVDTKVETRV
jgi:hypothetical protein